MHSVVRSVIRGGVQLHRNYGIATCIHLFDHKNNITQVRHASIQVLKHALIFFLFLMSFVLLRTNTAVVLFILSWTWFIILLLRSNQVIRNDFEILQHNDLIKNLSFLSILARILRSQQNRKFIFIILGLKSTISFISMLFKDVVCAST